MLSGRHTQIRDVRNVTETSLSTKTFPITAWILHSWEVKSSCSRYPMLINDRWRSDGSRTHVLHLFADVRTRSRVETSRIEMIMTANVRTCTSKRWPGIALGKVSSLYWRLIHAQGLDRHTRGIRSNCSRWSRNDILNYCIWLTRRLDVIKFSKSMSPIWLLFDRFRLSFTESFRFNCFLRFKFSMTAQLYFLHVLRTVVSVRVIKSFEKDCVSSTYFCHWKLPCTSWSLWLNDATRTRTVFSSRFSLRVEFHLYWTHYCTYYLCFAFFGCTIIPCIRSDGDTSLQESTLAEICPFPFYIGQYVWDVVVIDFFILQVWYCFDIM